MIDSSTTYADLDGDQRRNVDATRDYVRRKMLSMYADELREKPHLSGEFVDDLIDGGYLADHIAALRWMATLGLPPAA